tara:strand:+ start:81 stop:614 length:534 start_codon:yes stop_codon:yes gene_type:complete
MVEATKQLDEKYCQDCGKVIKIKAELCPYCGVRQSRPPTQTMSFGDAVTNCLINNYANFRGRASVSEYWLFVLFTMILSFFVGMLDAFVFGFEWDDPMWFSDILTLVLFLPSVGAWIRRLHDVGKSGWWTLLGLTIIGIIPLFIWSVTQGDDYTNDYGEVPTNTLEKSNNQINYNNY